VKRYKPKRYVTYSIKRKFTESQESLAHSRYRKPPGHQSDMTKIEPPQGILL
jgi:hypothetical protein